MKRTLLTFAAAVVLLITSSGYNDQSTGCAVGRMAPEISLTNTNETLTLTHLRGNRVLLSFWNSRDAQSRQLSKYYAGVARQQGLRHISINVDDDRNIFEGIAEADGMDAHNVFAVTGKQAAKLREAYSLDNAFGTVLIDEQGRIAAINP